MEKIPSIRSLIFGLLFLYSCQKSILVDPVIKPPVDPSKTTITLSIKNDTNLVYGDSIKLKWNIAGIMTSCTENGYYVGKTDSLFLNTLIRDTAFTFVVTNKSASSTTTRTINIKIGDWTTSTFGLLTQGDSWIEANNYYYLNKQKQIIGIYQSNLLIVYEFSNNWKFKISYNGGVLTQTDYSFYGENSFRYAGTFEQIEGISKDSLFLLMPEAGSDNMYRYKFAHAKLKNVLTTDDNKIVKRK